MERGDMTTGWWVMNKGVVRDRGSMYRSASLSRSLGRGKWSWPSKGGTEFELRSDKRSEWAEGVVKSGKVNPNLSWRVGMNSAC